MTQAPPDDGFGRAVRLASDRMAREGADCPSPDELSAFADGALSGDELSAMVVHLSTCARCQDIVSAVVRLSAATDLPEAPTRRPGGEVVAFPAPPGRRMWRWVVPVAAATAAVLAWVVVSPVEPRRAPAVAEDAPTVRNEVPSIGPLPEAVGGDARAERSPSLPDRAVGASGGDGARNSDGTAAAPVVVRPGLADSPTGLSAAAAGSDVTAAPANDEARRQAAPAGIQAPADPSPVAAAEAKRRSVEGALPAAPSPAAPAENRAAPPRDRPNRAVAGAGAGAAAALSRTPSPSRRWRVESGVFEESRDDGQTWRAFRLPAGARVTVAEPAAPDVWWLAGPAGLVLRIEGGRVSEAARPSSSDINVLRATSASGAVVGTSDGHLYETRDEGRTWQPQPSRE